MTASSGIITSIAGDQTGGSEGDGGNADYSRFHGPYSIYYDGEGNLFIADTFNIHIRKISGNMAMYKFPPIRVKRTSAPNPQMVENDGNADLSLTPPAPGNASLDPATTTCTLPQTLAQDQSYVLGIAFSPIVLETRCSVRSR